MHNSQDKYIISEFHGFEVDKKIIKEALETNSTISIKCILQKSNTLNRNGRVYPSQILKREVLKYSELVRERSAMGELDHPDCQSPDTQILTKNGWQYLPNISEDEQVYTLNINTNKIELQKIEKKIDQPYKGLMYHFKGRNIDQLVTPNHRFLIENSTGTLFYKTADELFNYRSNKWKIPKKGNWTGKQYEYFELPIFNGFNNSPKHKIDEWSKVIKINSKDWFAFLGIYLAEGSAVGTNGYDYKNNYNYSIKITQSQLNKNKKIENLFNRLPFENKRIYTYSNSDKVDFIITDARLHQYLFPLGNSHTKYIPEEIKNASPELLSILLEWFHIGDGKTRGKKHKAKEVFSTSKKLIEDLHEILIKSGGHGNIHEEQPVDRYIDDISFVEKEIENEDGTISLVKEQIKTKRLIKSENSKTKYFLHFSTTDFIYLDKRNLTIEKIENYDDRVYCVRVQNGNFYTMRNGKSHWVGNSAVISLSNVSHLVTEMWWEGETLWGKIEVAETPSGNILKGLLKSGFKLGISSRGVGSVKSSNDKDVVQDDFELIAFDVVSSPSTPGAYLFKEGRQWGMKKLTSETFNTMKPEDVVNIHKDKYNNIIQLSEDDFWQNL